MVPYSILVVDDNPINLKMARFALEADGYQVRTAADGKEMFLVLREFQPRVILMDIQLPDVDGLELTRQLTTDPETRDIVIVAVTAYAMAGDRERMIRGGCDGYIAKPLDPIRLSAQIQEYLANPLNRAPLSDAEGAVKSSPPLIPRDAFEIATRRGSASSITSTGAPVPRARHVPSP